MNSQAAVNSLFSGFATGHTLHSKDAVQLQDMLSRLMFGTPLQHATPLQLQALQVAAATAINPSGVSPLGLTDGGALFSDTYRSLVISGGIMSATGSHIYGHSPQAMAAASGIMAHVATNAGGSSITNRGLGGSTKLATGVIGQLIRREGLSGLGGTQVLQRGENESLGAFANKLFDHKGTTYKEKLNIATQEMGGEVYAELLQTAAKRFQNDKEWREQYGIDAEMAAKLENLDVNNYDLLSTDLRKVVDRAVMDLAKGKEGKAARDKVIDNIGADGKALDLLSDVDVSLDSEVKLRAAREAARKKNQYTVLDEQAANAIRDAQRRQLELTGEMSEVFGTDDANKLLEIAKLFGVRTLDTERDVTEMKRVMDTARARAESTGRSLADVMGEMQGIAAVGAQALGRFGVSASFIQHAVSQTQVSEASRAAGLDFRTPEQVQASLVAEEHNFQNNNLNWMYAYEHIKKNAATASAEDLAWVAEVDKALKNGPLDDATARSWEQRGAAYNAKNAHNVSLEQMQKTVTEGSIMHTARTSYQLGNVEDNLRGHTADILKGARVGGSYEGTTVGRALFNKDKGIYKDITTQEAQELAFAEDMDAIGRQYGGDLKLFRDDYRTVKGFNKLGDEDRAKAIADWKSKKLTRAKDLGATEEQLAKIEKTLDAIVRFGSSEGGDVAAETAMNMLRGHTLNNYTGTFGQLEQRELQLASQRKLIDNKTAVFMKEGAGYSQFGKRGDSTVDGLLSLAAANGGVLDPNKVLINRENGTFNVGAINTLDPTKLAATGYEAGEYVAAHTFAVAAGENGKLDFEATKVLAKRLEAQIDAHRATLADAELAEKVSSGKATEEETARYRTAVNETNRALSRLKVMRSTFQIADGQSVSAGMAQMSDKQLEAAMYDAENRSHSVMRDQNGNMVVGAKNESQTDAIDTGLQEKLLFDAAVMNIGKENGYVRGYVSRANAGIKYATLDEKGQLTKDKDGKVITAADYGKVKREKGVAAGTSYDMSTEEGRTLARQDKDNALLEVQNNKEFAFIQRTMEAAGTTEITEATGTVKRKKADGGIEAYQLSQADDRERLIVDTMNSNLDYQREVRAQAAEGDNIEAMNAVAKHGLGLNDIFNGDSVEAKARRSHAYGIAMARNDKKEDVTGQADYESDDDARKAVREQFTKLSSLEKRRSEIVKKHRSGELTTEQASKQMKEVIKEIEDANKKIHELTDYTWVSDDTRRNMGGQRLLTKDEANKAGYEEQMDQVDDEKEAIGIEQMTKDVTAAVGTNTDDVDATAKKEAAEEEKFGIFKEWNRQFTKNEGHATINATILAALQTLSAAFINDDGYNLKIDY